jgi:Glycosyltransferase Family 4
VASSKVTAQKIPRVSSGRSCRRCEGYAVALAFQEKDRASGNALPVVAVVVVATKLTVYGAVGQDAIDDPQQGMRRATTAFLGPRWRNTRRKRTCRALSFAWLAPGGQVVCRIRLAPAELPDLERATKAGDMLAQVALERSDVEAVLLAHLGGWRDHADTFIGEESLWPSYCISRKCQCVSLRLRPLFEAVPPQLYGGTERVVSHLTEELVRRGHDVTLFASGDSQTAATLVPVVPRAMRLGSANRATSCSWI